MRALLVYNPSATTTTPRVRDAVARALATQTKLDVEATKRRDHAAFLAAGAVHEGYELIAVLGGDGTVNEAVQGLACTGAKLAILPGGSTNVWARSLGLPNDAVAATRVVLDKLRDGDEETVTLGLANERYFGFTAGYGYDAHVVREVERRVRLKRTIRQATFVWCGFRSALSGFDRKLADISLTVGGQPAAAGLRSVVCCNTDPYTYLGPFPIRLCPRADARKGLDAFALTRLGLARLARLAATTMRGRTTEHARDTLMWHDETAYDLHNRVPLPLQVDGDFVGETDAVRLRTAPGALTVVA